MTAAQKPQRLSLNLQDIEGIEVGTLFVSVSVCARARARACTYACA